MKKLIPALTLFSALQSEPALAQEIVQSTQVTEEGGFANDVTNKRVWLVINGEEEGKACDKSLLLFPGYTEMSNSWEGDFLDTAIESMQGANKDLNVCVLGFNPLGRGLEGENINHDALAKIGFADYLREIEALTTYSITQWPEILNGELTVFGHSMGALAGLEASKVLLDNHLDLKHIVISAPASDKAMPGLNPAFLDLVIDRVPKAIYQTIVGKGATDLTEKQHQRIMGTDQEEAEMAVPDSGKLFLGWGFKFVPVAGKDLYTSFAENGVKLSVLEHEEDRLIPKGVPKGYLNKAERIDGLTVDYRIMPNLPHGIPLDLSSEQKNAFSGVFAWESSRAQTYSFPN